VEKLHAALLTAMKEGAKLGFEGRRKLLDPVIRETFDLATMARISCGGAWQSMSEADRARVVEAFAKYTIANYASQFKEWSGDKFVTKSETDAGRGRHAVDTELQSPGDDPTELNYQLRETDGQWKIVDIYLDGSVSQLAVRRSEFAATLAQGGVDALVASIEKTVAGMKSG
jgi:phospholipid transport system substrate-binding protein